MFLMSGVTPICGANKEINSGRFWFTHFQQNWAIDGVIIIVVKSMQHL